MILHVITPFRAGRGEHFQGLGDGEREREEHTKSRYHRWPCLHSNCAARPPMPFDESTHIPSGRRRTLFSGTVHCLGRGLSEPGNPKLGFRASRHPLLPLLVLLLSCTALHQWSLPLGAARRRWYNTCGARFLPMQRRTSRRAARCWKPMRLAGSPWRRVGEGKAGPAWPFITQGHDGLGWAGGAMAMQKMPSPTRSSCCSCP